MKKNKLFILGIATILSCGVMTSCGSADKPTPTPEEVTLSFFTPSYEVYEAGTSEKGVKKTSETYENEVKHYVINISFMNGGSDTTTYDISKLTLSADGKSYKGVTFFRLSQSQTNNPDKTQSSYVVEEEYKNRDGGVITKEVKTGKRNSEYKYVDFGLTSIPSSFEIKYDGNSLIAGSMDEGEDNEKFKLGSTDLYMFYDTNGFKEFSTGNKKTTYENVETKVIDKTYYSINTSVSLSGADSKTLNATDFTFKLDSSSVSGKSFLTIQTEVNTDDSITTTNTKVKTSSTSTVEKGSILELIIEVDYSSTPSTIEMLYQGKAVSIVK